MKNKIIAICISLLVSIAFIVPPGIFAEENAADGTSQAEALNNEQIEDNSNSEQTSDDVTNNEEIASETENENSANANAQDEQGDEEAAEAQMAKSPQNAPEDETPWAKLKKKIEEGSSQTIAVNEDVIADLDKDAGKTINIKSGKNIVLKGSSQIKGIGFSSFKVDKGGSLTINGPSISNAQIITKGDLTLNSGKISDTKLEGPTIFVNAGTFTMNGGEVSGNEAVESSTPKPVELKKIGDFYQYSPITVYSGTFTLNAGTISSNKSFLKGGAIGAWGADSSKANVNIFGGEIKDNKAEHSSKNAQGGSIYIINCDFEMHDGVISKNIAEEGGGIAAIKSKMTFSGGNITENTNNGDFLGEGGGILAYDTNINIKNINISNNTANGDGGGISIHGRYDKPNINIESGIFKGNSASKDSGASGGALLVRNCTYRIDGGTFTENNARYMGGAICFTDKSDGKINAGLFSKNAATGKWGGGAILNDYTCKLVIKRALIRDNKVGEGYMIGAGNYPASKQGGGIFNCPTGDTKIYITNGLALFDNSAPNLKSSSANKGAGDDFINITSYSSDKPETKLSQVKLASRMLGGGYRLWYQDGSFHGPWLNWPEAKQTPRYDPNNPGDPLPYNTDITEKKGAQLAYKSVPTADSKALANQVATTIFKDNVAYAYNFVLGGESGGAISNNGKLIFGEDTPYKIKIVKSWSGDDSNTRPKKITLKMYVGKHYVQDVVLTEEENWTKTIEDFPDPDTLVDNKTSKVLPINFIEVNSGKYVLSVTKTVKDKESSTYTIDLENTIPKPPEKITVEGSKTWDDAENQDGMRPESININLLKNGTKIDAKTVKESDGWKWKFENLDKYENGKLIEYTISEEKVEGYKTEITGNTKDGFVVTNTKEPEKIKVEGLKTWNDKNNKAGIRPKSITINLFKNGEKIASKHITEKDNWRYMFENLDKFENGKEIKYTISEDKVDKYTTEIDGFNITNTYIPPEKPPTPDTSDPGSMNILCIALLAASFAAIYTLRKKKNI